MPSFAFTSSLLSPSITQVGPVPTLNQTENVTPSEPVCMSQEGLSSTTVLTDHSSQY